MTFCGRMCSPSRTSSASPTRPRSPRRGWRGWRAGWGRSSSRTPPQPRRREGGRGDRGGGGGAPLPRRDGVTNDPEPRLEGGGGERGDGADLLRGGRSSLRPGATTLAKLADVAGGQVLVSGGVGVAPAWSASPTVTGLLVGDGSSGTPAIRFADQTTTGFYRQSNAVTEYVGNGTRTLSLRAGDVALVSGGAFGWTGN